MKKVPLISSLFFFLMTLSVPATRAQDLTRNDTGSVIDISGFCDSAHHWYDIRDEDHVINPLPERKRYSPEDVRDIADNILLFQKKNGGWPKNYDMLAILTPAQKKTVLASKNAVNTTFDNGATHTQVEYLAKAYTLNGDERYKKACLKGIDFILRAQYPNGGWPQFYPLRKDYSRYITFNDDAMIGVMQVLHHIVEGRPYYSFVDRSLRQRVKTAFEKGIDCILNCQINENGKITVWCQQHDDITLKPRWARTFEPPSACSFESSDIVMLLMSIDHPGKRVIKAVQSAVKWFYDSRIFGIRADSIPAPKVSYRYHNTDFDVVVVKDPKAPPVWSRYYELKTNRPLFCNRRDRIVYSLAQVDRERRTGYRWYGYGPQQVLDAYPAWKKRWVGE